MREPAKRGHRRAFSRLSLKSCHWEIDRKIETMSTMMIVKSRLTQVIVAIAADATKTDFPSSTHHKPYGCLTLVAW